MIIKIRCRFTEYPYLICDNKGQFWLLPHKTGRKTIRFRKVNTVMQMGKPHINYKGKRMSLLYLADISTIVDEELHIDMPNKNKIPFKF